MESTGSFAYCRSVITSLLEKAMVAVQDVDDGAGQGEAIKAILNKLAVE